MDFASASVKRKACYEGESVGKGSKKGKYCTHGEYVVEVGNDIVGVMEDNI